MEPGSRGEPFEATGPLTVPAAFQATVKRLGEAPALHFKTGGRWAPISWSEYARAVSRFANFLLDEGLEPHDRVAIWAGNRPEWHIADLGTLGAGGATVAIYPTSAADQVQYILTHSESRVLVVEKRQFLDQIIHLSERFPRLSRIVLLDGEAPASDGRVIPWTEALNRGDAFSRTRPGLLPSRQDSIQPDDMASLIYTSGTTGTPKGAILTHRNLTWTAQALLTYCPLGPEDKIMSFLPLAHILERMFSHMRQVLSGCQVYFCPSIDQFLPVLREVRPTGFIGVPRVWEKLHAGIQARMDKVKGIRRLLRDLALSAAARRTASYERGRRPSLLDRAAWLAADRLVFSKVREGLGLEQSRIFVSTGAAISPQILRSFYGMGIEILELYGQTEVTGPSTTNRPGEPRFGTVGPPIPGVQIRIAEDGEVLVRGPNVFSGYFKDPQATAATLTEGWLHSGDMGSIDEGGRLTITDRKKDLFKTSGGKYVAPGAIENMLKGQAGISQAVVLGDGRPYVAALLTLDSETPAGKTGGEDASVKRAVEEAVAGVNRSLSHPEQIKRWAILPKEFKVGEELTPTLKVKRKVVAEKYHDQIEELYSDAGRRAG